MSKASMDWDLTSYFPAFGGEEMLRFKESLRSDLQSLHAHAQSLAPLCEETADSWESVLLESEKITERISHLSSYLGCLSSADANNDEYSREEAGFALLQAEGEKLKVELLRAVKEADDKCFENFTQRSALSEARHYIQRLRISSQRSMTPEKEVLAADLSVDGLHAWSRLYNTVSSRLVFDMHYPDGRSEERPISQRRALMEHADRRVRQAAFEGGNAAWQRVEDVAAAALNAISGTRLSLNRHRGVDHFLDIALFQAGIQRRTLDAMFEAIFSSIELPRRILQMKAQLQQTDGVAWYDLGAPLPLGDQPTLSWDEGKALVDTSFSKAYPLLGEFLRHTYDHRWIDWSPRPGKRPGAFCTGSLLTRESRVYMTYNGTLGDVRTLAHEIGHAFHSYVMRDVRTLARSYPMTLAESASTFGEMLLTKGALDDPTITPAQKASLLDMEVGHGAIFLLDIPVRYHFEKKLYEARAHGELSAAQLKALMSETQRKILGDALKTGGEDPLFWASKLHFYISGVTFYNFPYTFGFLLSRGLFAAFKREGADFLPRYEDFLRQTGSDSAERIAHNTLGCDLGDPAFWNEAIATLGEPLQQLESLCPQLVDNGA
ncbi:MAG: M3 family oligoendopeptidase [Candidatus Latescibacterota bacterium]|nr:M3 family oligoendopeptidase [Candidatus Latescibacterota bacterium]